MSDVTVLKTGRLYEADMLAEALTEAGIPHYRRQETFAGLTFAMPAMPAPGPGTFFTVLVPEIAKDDAEEVLASLPVEPENPGLWSFSPRPWARKVFVVYAVITLGVMAVSMIAGVIERIFN